MICKSEKNKFVFIRYGISKILLKIILNNSSLTVISLTYSYLRYRPSKWHFSLIVIFTIFLSLSPEILRMYNNQFLRNDLIDNESVTTHWQIIGMHCEGCRAAVIQALRTLDGVLSVNVDLETGRAELTTRNMIATEEVIQVVQSAGFQAKKL